MTVCSYALRTLQSVATPLYTPVLSSLMRHSTKITAPSWRQLARNFFFFFQFDETQFCRRLKEGRRGARTAMSLSPRDEWRGLKQEVSDQTVKRRQEKRNRDEEWQRLLKTRGGPASAGGEAAKASGQVSISFFFLFFHSASSRPKRAPAPANSYHWPLRPRCRRCERCCASRS